MVMNFHFIMPLLVVISLPHFSSLVLSLSPYPRSKGHAFGNTMCYSLAEKAVNKIRRQHGKKKNPHRGIKKK